MKKICCILLVCVLLTTILTSCGKNKNEATEAATETENTSAVVAEPTTADTIPEEETINYNDGDLDDPPENVEETPADSASDNDNTVETEVQKETEEVVYAEELTEFEKFLNMSAAEQATFVESFSDPMGFINWYNKAEEEHNRLKPSQVIDGNVIDAGDLIANKG